MQFFKISVILCFFFWRFAFFSPAKVSQPPLGRFAPNLAGMCLSDLGRKRRGRFFEQFKNQVTTHRTYCQVLRSCSVRMDSRAVCVWAAKKQKRKYISGIAAMTAGQILVYVNIRRAPWTMGFCELCENSLILRFSKNFKLFAHFRKCLKFYTKCRIVCILLTSGTL